MYFLIVWGTQITMYVVSIEPIILGQNYEWRKNIVWKNTLTKDFILARNLYHRDITVVKMFMIEFSTTLLIRKDVGKNSKKLENLWKSWLILNYVPNFYCLTVLNNPANIYLFKFNDRDTKKRCETCLKSTIRTPKRCH